MVVFTGVVFDVGLNRAPGQLQAKLLAAARCEQSVHVQSGQAIEKDQRGGFARQLVAHIS